MADGSSVYSFALLIEVCVKDQKAGIANKDDGIHITPK